MRRPAAAAFALFALAPLACGARSDLAVAPAPSPDAAPAFACAPSVSLGPAPPPPPPHAACLDARDTAAFDATWELRDPAWCVVGRYAFTDKTTPTLTWGRHGGPLAGGTQLRRWTPPPAPTGTLVLSTTALDDVAPSGAQLTDWAVDLPFGDWTAIGVGPAAPLPTDGGALWLVRAGHVEVRIPTAIPPAGPVVGLAEAGRTRLLFSGPIGSSGDEVLPRLLAIDDCRVGACGPAHAAETLPESDAIHPTGAFADRDGNVFVANLVSKGAAGAYQHVAAHPRTRIAPGACPADALGIDAFGAVLPVADGERVFTSGGSLAPGVNVTHYREAPSGALTGEPIDVPLIDARVHDRGAFTALLVDDDRRLWALDQAGTFWVLARR